MWELTFFIIIGQLFWLVPKPFFLIEKGCGWGGVSFATQSLLSASALCFCFSLRCSLHPPRVLSVCLVVVTAYYLLSPPYPFIDSGSCDFFCV